MLSASEDTMEERLQVLASECGSLEAGELVRQLRGILADEVEECAALLVAGDVLDIHDVLMERAAQYRKTGCSGP